MKLIIFLLGILLLFPVLEGCKKPKEPEAIEVQFTEEIEKEEVKPQPKVKKESKKEIAPEPVKKEVVKEPPRRELIPKPLQKPEGEDPAVALATILCEKQRDCQSSPIFNLAGCVQKMQPGLSNALAKIGPPETIQEKVRPCMGTIKNADCQSLARPNPPIGCEFLK